jgi:3D (Asp-Asp-Asp) domain-containing protein
MIRYKILAAVFSVIVAVAEEFSLLKSESPSPKVEEQWLTITEPTRPEPILLPTLTVSASVYHPEPHQTDSTPFITADGSRINRKDPGKHRWLAVSRNLHARWGGDLEFGDSLWVTGISDDLDGLYIVRDVMNRRFRNQVDILVGRKDKVMGFWKNVGIAKFEQTNQRSTAVAVTN